MSVSVSAGRRAGSGHVAVPSLTHPPSPAAQRALSPTTQEASPGPVAGPLRPSQVPVPGDDLAPGGGAATAVAGRTPRQPLRPSRVPPGTVPFVAQRLTATTSRPSAVSAGSAVPASASSVRDVLRGSGSPLPGLLRQDMQARLGADFSDVRVHRGAAARDSAAVLGARAYTVGSHVVIGDGGTDRHILAHELTHVLQQRRGPVAGAGHGAGLHVSDPSDRFEREAEAGAARALGAHPARQEPGSIQPGAPHATDSPWLPVSSQFTVQRYRDDSTLTLPAGNVNGKLSQHNRYFIENNGFLWVLDGAEPPRYSSETMDTPATGPNIPGAGGNAAQQYKRYAPSTHFYKDCLHTAEEIISEKDFKPGGVRSRVVSTEALFGDTDASVPAGADPATIAKENIDAAQGALVDDPGKVNEAATAGLGEAFVIVETDGAQLRKQGAYPFHAAGVVAVDGADRVTLEVFAGEKDATARTTKGEYAMYGSAAQSFHAIWQAALFDSASARRGQRIFSQPITVVIEPVGGKPKPNTDARQSGRRSSRVKRQKT